jgi:hypothetical protein
MASRFPQYKHRIRAGSWLKFILGKKGPEYYEAKPLRIASEFAPFQGRVLNRPLSATPETR